ncbi:hypothetical protein UFOVP732_17 [uncultured Caudovirales phage]|uniref:Uncharacterized protein n=1 Tax=uncultured Caudovirales phage TaxID=2100421 RepID=A0A6J5NUL8_9CAUD|nr:hypothetical protein UFOVP732_17 [uncultured Caudovirales phage]
MDDDDDDTGSAYPGGSVWYPNDTMCLRAEAVCRLAQASIGTHKDTRVIINAAMRSIVYTMAHVYPHIAKSHRLAMAEVEAADATKH